MLKSSTATGVQSDETSQISEDTDRAGDKFLHAQMVSRAIWGKIEQKAEAYNETDIVSAFPPLHHFSPDGVWVGSFSRSIPTKKWRLLNSAVILTEGEAVATPPQIARAYLDWKYPKQLRAKEKQLEFWKPRRTTPLYTQPGQYPLEHVYLDLRSAYWSILQIIGWDVDYFPGMLAKRSDNSDFPYPSNKLARNSLVSLGLPSRGYYYKNGAVTLVPHRWKVNIGLWTAVQDILNGVAEDMVKRAGAVYVNTDGYIVPWLSEHIAHNIAAEWGLVLGEKFRGRATVYGVGAYSIGEHICKRHMRMSPTVDNISPHYKDRLKRGLLFLSEFKRKQQG